MSLEYITQDILFVRKPAENLSLLSIDEIYQELDSSSINYDTVIDQLYHIIKSNNHISNINQLLKLWEIRLNLLVFSNRVDIAQQEAINLNNILYLQENIKDESITVYPLPKLDLKYYRFLILILKLKSEQVSGTNGAVFNPAVGLNIINEIYKLNYQLRLKDTNQVQLKLIDLSYKLIINLIRLNSFNTLLTFLNGVIHELVIKTGTADKLEDLQSQYLSNLIVIALIVNKYLLTETDSSKESIKRILSFKFTELFNNQVNQYTYDTFSYIINKSVSNIDDFIEEPILFKTVIKILGLWDLLDNNPLVTLQHKESDLEPEELPLTLTLNETQQDNVNGISIVDKIYNKVNNQWYNHLDKSYGLNR
ncbi:uncharacterized protein RJT21DRAFT_1006 [Scheffersomyces amazonensis]|uniref:uncharacterized protein n=1 Tax=Scheffersomyces amazonensis TaxID=1078765 RepID=UPI00315D36D9